MEGRRQLSLCDTSAVHLHSHSARWLLLLLCLQSSLSSSDDSLSAADHAGASAGSQVGSGCPSSPTVRVVVHYMLWFSPE
jgi:hypothetical protein